MPRKAFQDFRDGTDEASLNLQGLVLKSKYEKIIYMHFNKYTIVRIIRHNEIIYKYYKTRITHLQISIVRIMLHLGTLVNIKTTAAML